jgi:undecaprenyl-diphosphatase
MATLRRSTFVRRAAAAELSFCVTINRCCGQRPVQAFFAIISRLGDGILWYSLIVVLPFIYGKDAVAVSLQMGLVGFVGLMTYKAIKRATSRQRPCNVDDAIRLGTDPLDHYSFPSGHTLHAVGFSTVALFHYPELGWLLIPFSALVAASRIILGLHYPTDVLAGAAIGASIASSCLILL